MNAGGGRALDIRRVARALAIGFVMSGLLLSPVIAQKLPGGERPLHPSQLVLPDHEFVLPEADGFREQLSNGIPVYLVQDRSLPLVEIVVVVSAGGADDPTGKEGLAAFTGSMVRRGGAGELDADAFDQAVDSLGATLDSFGGTRRSGISLSCSSRVLDRALELAMDALRRPNFEQGRLERAKLNLLTSLAQQNDDPSRVAAREWRILMRGPDHPDSRALTESSLAKLDRDALVSFHYKQWTPSRMVIAASGDFDREALLRQLERTVGAWTAVSVQDKADGEDSSAKVALAKEVSSVVHALDVDSPQTVVWMGHEGQLDASYTARERFVGILLSEILAGSGPISRLRSVLRAEQPLVYFVGGSLGVGTLERGLFEVSLATEPERAVEALVKARGEMERLRATQVSEVELGLAKRALLSNFPLLFETAEGLAGRFAEDELLGRPHSYWKLYADSIRDVSAREIRSLARLVLHPDRLQVLIVGPRQRLQLGELERAGFGKILDLSVSVPLEPDRPGGE